MNIVDFEKDVSQVILDRGYLYYRDNKIKSYKRDSDEFIFNVDGTENYEVKVQIDDNNIKNSRCNCPYDFTFTCKHEVAAYYKIREIIEKLDEKIYRDVVFEPEAGSLIDDYKENLENLERIKSENRKQIENLLATYSKEKMLHILLEIADKNIDVRDRLLKEIELRTNEKLDEKEFLKKYNKKNR